MLILKCRLQLQMCLVLERQTFFLTYKREQYAQMLPTFNSSIILKIINMKQTNWFNQFIPKTYCCPIALIFFFSSFRQRKYTIETDCSFSLQCKQSCDDTTSTIELEVGHMTHRNLMCTTKINFL